MHSSAILTLRAYTPLAAWVLTGLSLGVAVLVWGQNIGWSVAGLTAYSWFPLFGLSAFSLMWAHYMVTAAWRGLSVDRARLKTYYSVTRWAVLVALLLHPGLLAWQLWVDGFGLPPLSYLLHYVPPDSWWVALLGVTSLVAFLAYELWRWFDKKSWWRWVAWASEFAMIAIFYHGARLGGELQVDWFRGIWLLYGISLVVAFAYLHWWAYRVGNDPQPWKNRSMVVGVLVTAVGSAALLAVAI